MGYLSVSRHQISVIPADSCRCTGHNGLYDAPFGIIQLLLLDYCIWTGQNTLGDNKDITMIGQCRRVT